MHSDPILDLQVKVEQVEDSSKLFYYYYRKAMANWQLMHANSALSASVKRTSLTQYGLRILRYTKLEVPWVEKAEMLSEFSARLRDSGYRQEVIQSVLRGWEKMVEEQEAGQRPINRARSWQEAERRKEKERKKTTWYKSGGYSTVIFCPRTAGSELAEKWRELEEKGAESRGWRYKVVEQGGRQIRSLLCRNPWAGPCSSPLCKVCTTGGRGPCRRPGCTYKVQCMACEERGPDTVPEEEEGGGRQGQGEVGVPCLFLYQGESGYSAFTRGQFHDKDEEKKKQSNIRGEDTDITIKTRSVIFVDQTPGGQLAASLREMFTRLEHLMGFRVKVAEKSGCSLKSKFSLTRLLNRQNCGRDPCMHNL